MSKTESEVTSHQPDTTRPFTLSEEEHIRTALQTSEPGTRIQPEITDEDHLRVEFVPPTTKN